MSVLALEDLQIVNLAKEDDEDLDELEEDVEEEKKKRKMMMIWMTLTKMILMKIYLVTTI